MRKVSLTVLIMSLITTVLFISTASAAAPFKDVPTKHWAHNDIQILTGKSVLNGYSDGSFKPGQNVTRDQAAKIVSIAASIEPIYPKTATYPDVPTSHWAFGYIEGLSAAGVIDGKDNGSFAPKESLTRAQMAKILTESFDLEASSTNYFRDVTESAWMFEYVMALRDTGITLGYPEDNSYRPYGNVTRAQMAAFANRAMMWEVESKVEPIPESMEQEIIAELHKLHNEARVAGGQYELSINTGLSEYATAKSKDMFLHGKLDHFSPTWNATTIDYMKSQGFPIRLGGTNIATGFIEVNSTQNVINGWVNGTLDDKRNVLNGWDSVGYGIYGDMASGKIYYTAIYVAYPHDINNW